MTPLRGHSTADCQNGYAPAPSLAPAFDPGADRSAKKRNSRISELQGRTSGLPLLRGSPLGRRRSVWQFACLVRDRTHSLRGAGFPNGHDFLRQLFFHAALSLGDNAVGHQGRKAKTERTQRASTVRIWRRIREKATWAVRASQRKSQIHDRLRRSRMPDRFRRLPHRGLTKFADTTFLMKS